MLRTWGKTQQMLIEPDALSFSEGGVTRRMSFDGAPESALTGNWDASGDDALRAGGCCQVLLADTLVRYLVIRWPEGLLGSAERSALVAHRFREVHGLASPEWHIAVETSVTGMPVLACAVSASLVQAVTHWGHSRRLQLAGMTGEFVAVYNRLRQRIANPSGALSVQRDARVTIGFWRDGSWLTIRSQPCSVERDSRGENMLGIFRSQFGSVDTGESGVLYCVGGMREPPDGWQVQSLE